MGAVQLNPRATSVSARSWCESLPCPDEDVCFPEHLSVNCHTGKRTFLVEKPEARAHRPAEAKTQKWNYACAYLHRSKMWTAVQVLVNFHIERTLQ